MAWEERESDQWVSDGKGGYRFTGSRDHEGRPLNPNYRGGGMGSHITVDGQPVELDHNRLSRYKQRYDTSKYYDQGEGEIGGGADPFLGMQDYLADEYARNNRRVEPDKVDDTYLTEDEHRAEVAKMAHPTSLMMANPMMPAAQQMLGNMGYGTGQMPGMNQMQDMNQFMDMPFSSGLGGMFPNNQIPINPSMPDGSLTQPAANNPGGTVPRGYGHTAGAAPSWTQGQTGQQGLMNSPMQGQGMNGMWNGLMGMFGGK